MNNVLTMCKLAGAGLPVPAFFFPDIDIVNESEKDGVVSHQIFYKSKNANSNTTNNTIVRDSPLPCAGNDASMCGIHVRDMREPCAGSSLEHIKSNSKLWTLYDEQPRETMLNIVTYCLYSAGDTAEGKRRAKQVFQTFQFDKVYGVNSWGREFTELLDNFVKTFNPKRAAPVFSFRIKRALKDIISEPDLYVPALKQKVGYDELTFVAQKITSKVRDAQRKYGDSVARISHEYFLNGKYDMQAQYKAKTGRSLYRRKLVAITEMLEAHQIVAKIRRRKLDGTRAANLYQLGTNNPYGTSSQK